MSLPDRSALSEQRDTFGKPLIAFISQCDRQFTPQNPACDSISVTLHIRFNFWQHTHSSSWTTAYECHIKQQICCVEFVWCVTDARFQTLASFCHYQNGNWKRMSWVVYLCGIVIVVVYIEEAGVFGLTLVYEIPDASNGENNSFRGFSTELNGGKVSLTCWGRRSRELCAEYTINCLGPVAVVTRAHRHVNVRSRLSTEERETFGNVGGLMSVNTESAHLKLYLDLSAQHTNMWYFYNSGFPGLRNEPVSELALHCTSFVWFAV